MAALSAFLALGTIATGSATFQEISGAGAYARQPIGLLPISGVQVINRGAA